jgi:hypothetical protein
LIQGSFLVGTFIDWGASVPWTHYENDHDYATSYNKFYCNIFNSIILVDCGILMQTTWSVAFPREVKIENARKMIFWGVLQ